MKNKFILLGERFPISDLTFDEKCEMVMIYLDAFEPNTSKFLDVNDFIDNHELDCACQSIWYHVQYYKEVRDKVFNYLLHCYDKERES